MNNQLSSGPVSWMIQHRVAPNLIMAVLIIGGLMMSLAIKKEFLPTMTLDMVNISVAYPGATPDELERGIVLPIENELSDIDGIKELTVSISQGSATVTAEIRTSAETQRTYQDIQQAVNRIATFPEGIEQPIVALRSRNVDVLEIVVHGGLDNVAIKRLAEKLKDRILQSPHVTNIEFRGLPAEEIHIDIPQLSLQAYDLTLADIANLINASSLERSAGSVKTGEGEILVTVNNRQYWAHEFARLPIISGPDGDQLLLGDIATIREGFEDTREIITFDGDPGVSLRVYRVEEQTPDEVVDAVYAMWGDLEALLPPGTRLTVIDDDAKTYTQRLELLLKNAFLGLILVMILLGLFLEYRLAFWVVVGIPTSFLGAILFLPFFNVSINVISMFGFIIALGIVVDDAIIAGENIYEKMQKGVPFQQAAIEGTREIAVPLTFAILTNIVAFLPLLFVPGAVGMMFSVTPIVVIACFLISWVEALFILPTHLANLDKKSTSRIGLQLDALQQHADRWLHKLINTRYLSILTLTLRYPGLTISISVVILSLVLTYGLSGRLGFSLFPPIEGEWAVATAELPLEAPLADAINTRQRLEAAATQLEEQYPDLILNKKSEISGSSVEVALLLAPSESRPISALQTVTLWRQALGQVANVKSISFDAERGGGSGGRGAALTVELRHSDNRILAKASADLENYLNTLDGVDDVSNDLTNGKPQWSLKLNQHGRALGLTERDISTQLRNSLYGARAIRQQRQRNEVTVLVRLPESERQRAADIRSLLIQTAQGFYVPLAEVADIAQVRAPARINRRDGSRIVNISADVNPRKQLPSVMTDLNSGLMPQLESQYPGLAVNFRGRQAEAQESVNSLQTGTIMTILVIYALLAIPFRSYIQPLLVVSIIPFGAMGALLGHMIMGQTLSVSSIQGMVALMGVVVNDSLIMIDYANRQRQLGLSPYEAAIAAATRRFRPILLTTLTTFGGLAPMVFETSRQAQFVIPMAISLGFGIVFTTVVCLLMLPALYLVVETLRDKIGEKSLTTEPGA